MNTPKTLSRELAELVSCASAGEPQVVQGDTACVVISLADYERLSGGANLLHPGKWLIDNAPRIGDIDLPPRTSDRPVPFGDWTDEEMAE